MGPSMERLLEPWQRADPTARLDPLRQLRWIIGAMACLSLGVGLFAWWSLEQQRARDERIHEKIIVPFRQLSYYGWALRDLDTDSLQRERLLDSLERAYALTYIDAEDSAMLSTIRRRRSAPVADLEALERDFATLVEKNHDEGEAIVRSNREAARTASRVLVLFSLLAAGTSFAWGLRIHRLETEKFQATEEVLALLESAPEAIFLVDADTQRILAANPAASRLTGYREKPLRRLSFPQLAPSAHPDGTSFPAVWSHLAEKAMEGRDTRTAWILLRPDGREVPCELLAVRHPSLRARLVRATLVDLTDRVESERARAASEARLRSVLETCGLAIRISRAGKAIYANPACVALFGHPSAESLLALDVLETYAPGFRDALAGLVMRAETVPEFDAGILRLDGSTVPVRATLAAVELEDGPAVIAFLIDTTETVQAREREEQSRVALEHADRLAALGTLSAGIAHEINNPNNLILFNADLLEKVLPEALAPVDRHAAESPGFQAAGMPWTELREEITALLQGVQGGAERIRLLVAGLKDFVRGDTSPVRKPCDLNAVALSAHRLLGGTIRSSTDSFRMELEPDLPLVLANAQQIEQIAVNLLTNACEALPDRSRPIVLTTRRNSDGFVELEVRDRGVGIPPENLPRVLDPFFTTRREEGGTGLGLSVSWGIVRAHQGDLTIANHPEGGAVATLRLPVAESSRGTLP